MQKIFFYKVSDEHFEKLKTVLETQDIHAYRLSDDCLNEKLSTILDHPKDYDGESVVFGNSYMLVDDVKIGVKKLLDLYRENDCAYEGITVTKTDTNQDWTLKYLFTETGKEHELFMRVKHLDECLKECNQLDLSSFSPGEGLMMKNAMVEGYLYLKGGKYRIEQLDEIITMLEEGLKKGSLVN